MATSESHVYTRLRLWSPPASHEVAVNTNAITEEELRLNAIESQITFLEREISRLRHQGDELRQSLDARRSLSAPIRSLPLELLSEIFSLLCKGIFIDYMEQREPLVDDDESESFSEEDRDYETIGFSRIHATSAVLSQVCSTWNNILSNSTFAWSTISIHLGIEEDPPLALIFAQDMRKIENALTCVLGRSEGLPLHVSLSYYQEGDAEITPEILSIFAHLLGHIHRWKTANLRLSIAPRDQQVLSQLCAPMLALETLSFSLNHLASTSEANGINNFFCQTPVLRTVTFSCPQAFQRSKLMWANLHTIEIEIPGRGTQMPSISYVKSILSQCKALRSLTWNTILYTPEDSDIYPVVLPITTFKGNRDTVAFLPHVVLPDINTFDLTIPYAHSDASESVLPGGLDGYRSIITSLHVTPGFEGGGYSVETMFSRLGSFPALNSLKVGQYNVQDGLACDFSEMPRRLPKLKELSYRISGEVSTSALGDVLSLVEAFKRPTGVETSLGNFPSLRIVHLHFLTAYLDEEQRSMLRAIRDRRLCLEVRDDSGLLDLSGSNEVSIC